MQGRIELHRTIGFQGDEKPQFNPATVGLSRPSVRIIAVKLFGLLLLFFLTINLAAPRQVLSDAALESLLVQADTIVAALEFEARGGTPVIALSDPAAEADGRTAIAASLPPVTRIDRDTVETLFATILAGSDTRAALYGADGTRLTDSDIAQRTQSERAASTRPPIAAPEEASALGNLWGHLVGLLMGPIDGGGPAVLSSEAGARDQILKALGGVKTAELRVVEGDDIVVSVTSPLTDAKGNVAGALELVSAPGAISRRAREQELAIMGGFAIAAVVLILVGFFISWLITRPLMQLAQAADRIKSGDLSVPIPTLHHTGHLGRLSHAINEMTRSLYMKIDANASFAGEVAHELKNPLTSLRSAVETMPLVKSDKTRDDLLSVIAHDVRRIDRLITDISEASKLDAELNSYRYEHFDLIDMLRAVVQMQNDLAKDRKQTVELVIHGASEVSDFLVFGNDSRLSQVFTNLIDNSRSFSPDNSTVSVMVQRLPNFVEVVVDDVGPGIEEENLDRIFERFYTDRSDYSSFGDNSGLGLAISRQIVEAHHGEIFAENRYRTSIGPDRVLLGARFTVRLPTSN